MPTTCAFNSDPLATPAAHKVTLTGGGRPDRQPGRQEGVTGPRVLPPRLLGAATFPVTREAFYCQNSKCTPNTAADVFAAPAACRLRGRAACGALGTWACVPKEASERMRDVDLLLGFPRIPYAGGDRLPSFPLAGNSVSSVLLPQGGNSPTAFKAGHSAPGLAAGATCSALDGKVKQGTVPLPSRTKPGL